ncbi:MULTISPECIES: hypothetical protein [unclassified Microcoleus]|uniref:hypothetical protein n=1 Tax=unclassified Microcoleus TaxID=2642155 RepID=UPI002FD30088
MPSGNILTAADVLNLLVSGIDKTTLENELTASAWISTPARGGSNSPDQWLHLFFDIGGNNKIEALCQSIVIEQLAKQSLALIS